MKCFVSCFLLLPFLTSCQMGKPEYYEAGYYNSVPPRSEIYGYDEQPHHYRQGKKKVQAAAESSVSETKAVPNNVKKQS